MVFLQDLDLSIVILTKTVYLPQGVLSLFIALSLITTGQSPKDQCECHDNLSTKMSDAVIYFTKCLINSFQARKSHCSLCDNSDEDISLNI
ncbi:hypothetical protein PR048_012315 [Dryococelus australis]|uniref:Uncharacterized protein n=1 Tax=Dryococelus australis TaxID=614101 RepID=A0ABQ9HP64_9NEOP|nr:hypothetical protein PR048_012315 [Dryococelus australis]